MAEILEDVPTAWKTHRSDPNQITDSDLDAQSENLDLTPTIALSLAFTLTLATWAGRDLRPYAMRENRRTVAPRRGRKT